MAYNLHILSQEFDCTGTVEYTFVSFVLPLCGLFTGAIIYLQSSFLYFGDNICHHSAGFIVQCIICHVFHCRVDRNKYQIQIPLPPKIDPSVTMMTVEEKPDVTYNDVGGCKEQIEKMREVCIFLLFF